MMSDGSDSEQDNNPTSCLDQSKACVVTKHDEAFNPFECENILESQKVPAKACNEFLFDYGETERSQTKTNTPSIRGKRKRSTELGHQERWNLMYNRLLGFHEKVGHCLVPNRYTEDPQLGAWVAAQRQHYKVLFSQSGQSTPMTLERAKKLEKIGFEWNPRDSRAVSWDARFNELIEFVAKNGHAQVPMKKSENLGLSNWVSNQRQEYKRLKKGLSSRLTSDHVKKLESVGFIWEAKRGFPRRDYSIDHAHQRVNIYGMVNSAASSFGNAEQSNQGSLLPSNATQPWAMADSISMQSQNIEMAAAKQKEIELMQKVLLSQERQTNFLAQNEAPYNPNSRSLKTDVEITTLQAQEEQARRKHTIKEFLQLQSPHVATSEQMRASFPTTISQLLELQDEHRNQSIFSIPVPEIASDLQNYQRLPSSTSAHGLHDIDPQIRASFITNKQQDAKDNKPMQKNDDNSNFALAQTFFSSDDRKPSPVSTRTNLDKAELDKGKKRRQK